MSKNKMERERERTGLCIHMQESSALLNLLTTAVFTFHSEDRKRVVCTTCFLCMWHKQHQTCSYC